MSGPRAADDAGHARERARAGFVAAFGSEPRHAASAPGRVNLIGDHTDYCEGLVLPMAIDLRCAAVGSVRTRGPWRVLACDAEARDDAEPIEYQVGDPLTALPPWGRYVAGVIALVGGRLRAPSMSVAIASDVPPGGGLSSSAALEVALATLIEAAGGRGLGGIEKARLCRLAEREFAGVPCGIMDQMAAVFGERGRAMLIDCRDLRVRPVPLWDESSAALVVIDSGVRHDLADGAYAERRDLCEEAAQVMGVACLRDADEGSLGARGGGLTEAQLRSARHVVRENARVAQAAERLGSGDLAALGRLMTESHASLRDDMRVSCPELDEIVDAAVAAPGVLGARMTGGGFGGCAIALTQRESVPALEDRMRNLGRTCRIVQSGAGAGPD